MIVFLYNVALLLGLVVSLPWWLWRFATTEKYREGLAERLGRVKEIKSGGRPVGDNPVIWVHAVSVGEVIAVARLVTELDAALPGYRVVVSTTTRTGQALARQRFGAERVFYCPLDLPWVVRARLETLQPKMLVLAETEFWPNLLTGCFRRRIPVMVVNARVSDRSWPRYRKLRGLWRPILGRLTRVLAQSELDAERLRAIGCGPVAVSGNLKFDVRLSGEAEATRLLRGAKGNLRLVVAGSTLEGEEAALLEAWPRLLAAEPGLAMVLAVRHPERFAAVAGLLAASGVRWRRRSELGNEPLQAGEVVLLDSIGELASVYSLAAVAFVGGSLVAAGGHNPLEPALFGVPVVMGPHFENFRGIVEAMRAASGIRIVDRQGLAESVAELLVDETLAAEIGALGKAVYAAEGGATGRTVEAIRKVLDEVQR